MAYLILIRHGLTVYNEQGMWTGWADPTLVPEGIAEAQKAGLAIKGFSIDYAYTSTLKRAKETLDVIKTSTKRDFPTFEDSKLNERNYGDYTGKNKWEIKKAVGEKVFHKIRRSWDYPIPNGESLKQVYDREIPYFEENILPKVKDGHNVLIVSSGNALRALVKYLESVPDDEIAKLEIGTGEVYVYKLDPTGEIMSKKILSTNPNTGMQ